MSDYRRPGAWPRSVSVRGHVHPCSTAEVDILRDALELYVQRPRSPSWGRIARGLLHLWATGQEPKGEPEDLRAWRDRARAEERNGVDPREPPAHVDDDDLSLWRT